MKVENVAIIGAGISGLLTAYQLKQKSPETAITIFEKNDRVGGNVYTVNFDVGKPQAKSIQRWADLGVNDFNLASYKKIAALFKELGVSTKPLEDSTAFGTLDGSIVYVIDPDYKASDKDTNIYTNMPAAVKKGFDNFKKQAPQDLENPKYLESSISDYIQKRNANPPDWYNDEGDFYPDDFVNYNLYPRINGMYFVHDTVPSTMSFVGIMHYYKLQEGFGKEKDASPPDRVYVEGGVSTWVEKLCQELDNQGVSIETNANVQVSATAEQATISVNGKDPETFDAVVMACHASTALKLIKQGITDDMLNVLSQFDYYNSVAIAHTYAAVLPPDKNSWRTYNILIHGDNSQLRPYTISYVCNRHQNDSETEQYNHFGEPEFFVTVDPAVPIPDQYVLKKIDPTCADDPANANQPLAIATFAHNIVSTQTINAQNILWGVNKPDEDNIEGPGTTGPGIQGQNCLYFTGGWTLGAGLHEECFLSANEIANLIMGEPLDRSLFYRPGLTETLYAPSYIREAD